MTIVEKFGHDSELACTIQFAISPQNSREEKDFVSVLTFFL
jgi:hypothetical protein